MEKLICHKPNQLTNQLKEVPALTRVSSLIGARGDPIKECQKDQAFFAPVAHESRIVGSLYIKRNCWEVG